MHTAHTTDSRVRLQVVSVGGWAAPQGRDAPPHRHPSWKVTYYRTGRITALVDGKRYSIQPGTVLLVPRGAAHAEIATTSYSNYYALVEPDLDVERPQLFAGPRAREVGDLLAALLREHTQSDTDSAECSQALTTLLDATLRRQRVAERQPASLEIVLHAERLMQRRYSESLPIGVLAAELGCSPATLRRAFFRSGRPPPHTVLREMRINRALDLLTTSDLPLAAVAERCGFHSASHLSRDVKDHTGRTPGALRHRPRLP